MNTLPPLPHGASAPVNDGAQVKLALFGKPIPELLSYAGSVHSAMEDNEFYPDPQPPQDELAVAIEDAKAADLEVMGLQTQLAAAFSRRDALVETLLEKLNQRGRYVQLRSGGNTRRILSAGIDVRRDRRPVGELDVPTGLYVELGGTAGAAIITWDKVKNAKMYMIEYGPIDGPKVNHPVSGQRKLILGELPLGEMYKFRVCAMGGTTGKSDWSPWVTRGIA